MDNNFVALTKCFYCGENSAVVFDKYLGKGKHGKGVSELHGKVIDMEPCSKCEEFMKQGIILIGIVPALCDPDWHKRPENAPKGWIPNPYRSGHFAVVTESGWHDLANSENLYKAGLEMRFMFINAEILAAIIRQHGEKDAT